MSLLKHRTGQNGMERKFKVLKHGTMTRDKILKHGTLTKEKLLKLGTNSDVKRSKFDNIYYQCLMTGIFYIDYHMLGI